MMQHERRRLVRHVASFWNSNTSYVRCPWRIDEQDPRSRFEVVYKLPVGDEYCSRTLFSVSFLACVLRSLFWLLFKCWLRQDRLDEFREFLTQRSRGENSSVESSLKVIVHLIVIWWCFNTCKFLKSFTLDSGWITSCVTSSWLLWTTINRDNSALQLIY